MWSLLGRTWQHSLEVKFENNTTTSKFNLHNYIITAFSGIAKEDKCDLFTLSGTFLSPGSEGYKAVASRQHSVSLSASHAPSTFTVVSHCAILQEWKCIKEFFLKWDSSNKTSEPISWDPNKEHWISRWLENFNLCLYQTWHTLIASYWIRK